MQPLNESERKTLVALFAKMLDRLGERYAPPVDASGMSAAGR